MRGCFYGVGVGPGDPELVTLKAVRIIREVPVIAYPGGQPMDSTAWKIAAASVPEIRDKEKLGIDVPMTRDAALLEGAHRRAIRQIEALLDRGKSVAYITLGDPTIYSSYSYLQADIMKDGYRVETVSGVPSFCAAAAKLNIPLSEWEEELHIIPAAHVPEGFPSGRGTAISVEIKKETDIESPDFRGTVVCMKSSRKLKELRERLTRQNMDLYVVMNCGMEGEMVCCSADEIPDDAGYFTILIAKQKSMTHD